MLIHISTVSRALISIKSESPDEDSHLLGATDLEIGLTGE